MAVRGVVHEGAQRGRLPRGERGPARVRRREDEGLCLVHARERVGRRSRAAAHVCAARFEPRSRGGAEEGRFGGGVGVPRALAAAVQEDRTREERKECQDTDDNTGNQACVIVFLTMKGEELQRFVEDEAMSGNARRFRFTGDRATPTAR